MLSDGVFNSPADGIEAFTHIYKTNAWLDGSGPGSVLERTREFRNFLEAFIVANGIRSMVDFGCGDWQYMAAFPLRGLDYIGVEAVPELVTALNERHAKDNLRFQHYSGDTILPEADLLLCKDVLIHWPNERIAQFLHNINGKYKYSLFVCDVAQTSLNPADGVNQDIPFGGFRAVRLEKEPFCCQGAVIFEYYGGDESRNLFWKKVVFLAML